MQRCAAQVLGEADVEYPEFYSKLMCQHSCGAALGCAGYGVVDELGDWLPPVRTRWKHDYGSRFEPRHRYYDDGRRHHRKHFKKKKRKYYRRGFERGYDEGYYDGRRRSFYERRHRRHHHHYYPDSGFRGGFYFGDRGFRGGGFGFRY